jgi:hypothetical protein
MPAKRRRWWQSAAAALAVAALTSPSSALAGEPVDRLPDLQMARLSEFRIEVQDDPDRTLLRFSAVIQNKGKGPLVIRGKRDCTSLSTCPRMTTSQRIKRSDGSWRSVPSDGVARYDVGDGHNHWHIMDIETYELIPMDVPPEEAVDRIVGSKVGFCFFDTEAVDLSLPYSPNYRVFEEADCGVSTTTGIRVGLSVGWGDRYSWFLPRQWIKVTDVPSGRYLVCATTDAFGEWLERRDDNNQSWTEIELYEDQGRMAVRVIEDGKSSCEERLSISESAAWRADLPRAQAIPYRGPVPGHHAGHQPSVQGSGSSVRVRGSVTPV